MSYAEVMKDINWVRHVGYCYRPNYPTSDVSSISIALDADLHGIPLAINVGDALYSKMFELLVANRSLLGETKALDILDEMIRGARLTFEGQAFDIGWIEASEIPTVEEFVEMLRRKTGWYSGRGPCETGSMIGDEQVLRLKRLGISVKPWPSLSRSGMTCSI